LSFIYILFLLLKQFPVRTLNTISSILQKTITIILFRNFTNIIIKIQLKKEIGQNKLKKNSLR